MLLSLNGAFRNYSPLYGYGVAADNMVKGFKKNEINYGICDPQAQIEIFWGHPPYEFTRHQQYKIGFTAWESTGFPNGWLESMAEVDEIWTPATWLTEHFVNTLQKPGYTYPHGVDKSWKPFRHYRNESEPFRFLHIGEPQFRKNGQMVVDAFVELFGNDPNFQLIMKSSGFNTTRILNKQSGSIIGTPPGIYKNIIFIESLMEKDQLIELHNKVDCLIYPSAGEGFGLHPLEAAAAGLPTISTVDWCDYSEYISVPITAGLSASPWPDMHHGDMFNPTKEQVKSAMLDMVENYDEYAKKAFKNSFLVHTNWNWESVNYKAAEKLKNIFFSRLVSE